MLLSLSAKASSASMAPKQVAAAVRNDLYLAGLELTRTVTGPAAGIVQQLRSRQLRVVKEVRAQIEKLKERLSAL